MTKHLQKFTAVLLAAIMTLGVFTVVPFTASAATSGDFEYEILDDGTAKITGYTGTAAELTLPSELDGHKVTYFGSAWTFSGCTSLTSITFPDSASSIVETSLSSIENLTSITVNSNNANYSSINGVLFNKNKTELIIYPRGKTDENYTIPDSVQSISNHAFNGCTNLTSITVNSNNANYSSVDGVLFNKNKTELIIYPRGKTDENYTIPDSVTSIGYYAFQDCTNLKNIVVPNDITSIGAYAFWGCAGLKSITISDSVTSIGYRAFMDCENLASIIIPDSVTSIGDFAFDGCENLTSITIPNSVTSIGNYAFEGCTSLASITIPDSVIIGIEYSSLDSTAWFDNQPDGIVYAGKVAYKYKGEMPENTSLTIKDGTKSIGYRAFSSCYNLTSITIPDSVTSIGDDAFSSCYNLTSITIPDSVTSIGDDAFSSYLGNTAWFDNQPDGIVYAGKVAYKYKGEMPENTSLIIKDGTKSIGDNAFYNCENLTSITIPDSVTSIGNSAFYNCENLASITIPDSVTSIGDFAFDGCENLTSVTIPDSVSSIGQRAFYRCEKLTNITIPDSVSSIGFGAFAGCKNLSNISIPDSVSSIDFDNSYDYMCPGTFCGTALFNNQPDGIVYVGKIACGYKGKIPKNTSLIIKDGTKCINDNAFSRNIYDSELLFSEFPNGNITSITIPDSVTRIGPSAFKDCTGLTSITIPDSVTSIGPWAFNGCTNLTNITIPDSVTSIGRFAFGYSGYTQQYLYSNPTITGYKGTAAEKYANENGFKFIALDDSANPTNPTDPTESTEPTDPTNPIQPTEPNNPDDPANPNPDNTSKPSLGDIDGDGEISVNDVTDIQKYIVQIKPFTDEQMKFADVDKNGKIDVNDVTLLQKVIVKIAVI